MPRTNKVLQVKVADVAKIGLNKRPFYIWGFYVYAIKNNIELSRKNVEEWVNTNLYKKTQSNYCKDHFGKWKKETTDYIYSTLMKITEEKRRPANYD